MIIEHFGSFCLSAYFVAARRASRPMHGSDTVNEDDDDDWEDDPIPRAFRVDGELAPSSGPPATAEEYLRQVRY